MALVSPHLGCFVQFEAPLYQENLINGGEVWRRVTEMREGLEGLNEG